MALNSAERVTISGAVIAVAAAVVAVLAAVVTSCGSTAPGPATTVTVTVEPIAPGSESQSMSDDNRSRTADLQEDSHGR